MHEDLYRDVPATWPDGQPATFDAALEPEDFR